MAEEKFDKIQAVSRKSAADSASKITELQEPDAAHFDLIMQKRTLPDVNTSVQETVKTDKPGLIEEVSKAHNSTSPYNNPDQARLIAQTQNTVQTIEKAKETLARTELQLSGPYQRLMRNKLTHIDDNIKIALSKVGVDYKPPGEVTDLTSPINRFLGMLSGSQSNLVNLGTYLETMSATRQPMTAANMLAVQLKMSVVQQELELFISLLSKALESVKTIMNIQV